MLKKSISIAVVLLALTACGGGGGGGTPTVATGQFKDSNAAGISFVSGGEFGVTGVDGSFNYEVGKTVTFSVGGIVLGSSKGKSIMTPVDLVEGGDSSSIDVRNIVRFLMMLDSDGIPENGITVSTQVQEAAKAWTQVDFSAADLASPLTDIISDAASADSGQHLLPTLNAAQAHLESTLLCSVSGAYKGTFSGDDRGTFGLLIDASSGNVSGVAYSSLFDEFIGLSGSVPVSFDQKSAFVSGVSSDGATFSGQFTSVDSLKGSWQSTVEVAKGNFSGKRVGGVANALYRFTGFYKGGDNGLFSFDIDAQNTVTGIAYSIEGDEVLTLSGSLEGTSLSVTASDGTVIGGVVDLEAGSLSEGQWNDSVEGLSGTYTGGGCKLN